MEQEATSASLCLRIKIEIMGRGDKKTKRGKIFKGSFGKSRKAKETKQTKRSSLGTSNVEE